MSAAEPASESSAARPGAGEAAAAAPGTIAACLGPIADLSRISPREAGLLCRLVRGDRVVDLLFHLPTALIDRRARPALGDAPQGMATIEVEVLAHRRPAGPRRPHVAVVSDGTGEADLTFFSPRSLHALPVGARVVVSGRLDRFGGRTRITHPDHVQPAARRASVPAIEPVWPMTAGLGPASLRRAMAAALALLPRDGPPEWHAPALLAREDWPGWSEAIRRLQAPDTIDPALERRARARLAYDELLAAQLGILLVRRRAREAPGVARPGDGRLRAELLRRFGHRPTPAQAEALDAIDADLAAPRRMLRLLQGDVGAGKTLVALLAMMRVVESGGQAALMAPTEVLARQHRRTAAALSPVPVGLLVGGMKAQARRDTLAGLASGGVRLVVGTHALFGEEVRFARLGLAVIDEQHRFGVAQRLMLGAKGEATDILVMTATPIPRTLLLARWGEMEVSRIAGRPPGRRPIRTTLHPIATQLAEIVDAVGRAVAAGSQVFWVCPLVGESEASDLAAATGRFETLAARFGDAVGLAHGRQTPERREAAIGAFARGATRLLVATTVIEVGIDVRMASVMVIEHAERFGLAQLHQLRGRVGRGDQPSFCLLLYDERIGEAGRRRLQLLRETEDGFVIADEDFRMRGGGDPLGLRQSGLPGFRLGIEDGQERLLAIARDDAEALLGNDPGLERGRGRACRLLLRLMGQADGARLLEAG